MYTLKKNPLHTLMFLYFPDEIYEIKFENLRLTKKFCLFKFTLKSENDPY